MRSGSLGAGAAPGLEETGQHLEGQLPQGGQAGQSRAVGRGVGAQRCLLRLWGRQAGLAYEDWQRGRSPGSCSGEAVQWGTWGQGLTVDFVPAPQTPITKHQVTKGPNFISSPPVPPGKALLEACGGQRSPGLGARGPKAPQKLLLVLQVLPHLLAHVEDGAVPAAGGRAGQVRARAAAGPHQAQCPAQGWSGPFPGLWPRPAAHPPPSRVGLFAQRAWGGAITAGARGGAEPPAVYHLSPGVGTRHAHPFPGEKPGPTLGKGVGAAVAPGADPGRQTLPHPVVPHPDPWEGWVSTARFAAMTLRVRGTL